MSLTTKDRVSTPTGGDNRADRLAPGVWKVVCVAAIGSFMAQLDATVVNVSLASLAADLNVSLSAIQWVTSGYLLALALMLPLNGWLVDRIGAKALYLWCFAAFTLASALCGLAWSANSLIAFRILQGMSGGLLAPMAQLMIARAAGRHMARVVSVAALPVLLAPLLGPVIAGAILQFASWRWLFLDQPAGRRPGAFARGGRSCPTIGRRRVHAASTSPGWPCCRRGWRCSSMVRTISIGGSVWRPSRSPSSCSRYSIAPRGPRATPR